jgi:hypothetical protein
MLEQELINKTRNYLNSINLIPERDEISYTGIRKNALQKDGTKRDMHIVSFILDSNPSSPYVEGISAVFIDVETNELKFLVTPYYMKEID